MFYFMYTSELFILLQLLGITHANWWWIVWFVLTDMSTTLLFRSNKLVYRDYDDNVK